MSMNKLLAALVTGALLATSAHAAGDAKPADAGPTAEKGAKPKAKPHNHMAEGGRGMAADSGAAPSGKKKPAHEHNKEHKQQ